MQRTPLWRYSLFYVFPKLKWRSLTSCVQDGVHLGSVWLLLQCEMQRWLQNSFLRLKLSLYLLSPNTCGNTLVPEGSVSLFSKGTVGKIARVFQRVPVLRVTQPTLVERPGSKGRKTWCTLGSLSTLRLSQSEKELDQSLYKLRSAQLVVLQNVEQRGFTLLQLRATARQEQVPSLRGDLGQPGLLSLRRHIPASHLPGYNKNSLNAIRTWVTGWFCCAIISITAALPKLDFTADLVDNPYMGETKACRSTPISALRLPHLRPQQVEHRTFHPGLCLQYLQFAELSALVNTWCGNGPGQRRSLFVQPLPRVEEY